SGALQEPSDSRSLRKEFLRSRNYRCPDSAEGTYSIQDVVTADHPDRGRARYLSERSEPANAPRGSDFCGKPAGLRAKAEGEQELAPTLLTGSEAPYIDFVVEHASGSRLDIVLVRHLTGHSRATLQRWISEGRVSMDDRPADRRSRPKLGARITVR